MSSPLLRRAGAEAIGTALLVAAVIGSGISASRLSPYDAGLQLLQNSIATGAVLVALILALQPVSASFNPVVTLVERAFGRIGSREAGALVLAQLLGPRPHPPGPAPPRARAIHPQPPRPSVAGRRPTRSSWSVRSATRSAAASGP